VFEKQIELKIMEKRSTAENLSVARVHGFTKESVKLCSSTFKVELAKVGSNVPQILKTWVL